MTKKNRSDKFKPGPELEPPGGFELNALWAIQPYESQLRKTTLQAYTNTPSIDQLHPSGSKMKKDVSSETMEIKVVIIKFLLELYKYRKRIAKRNAGNMIIFGNLNF